MPARLGGLTVATCLIVAAGCAGSHVATDYSPSVGFSQFRTFSLVSRPDSASHQLIDDRVRTAVETQLAAKGLTETDREHADLFVGYGVVDRTHKQVYTTGADWAWGGGWGWRSYRWGVAWPMSTERSIETYTDGTVIVNLVDAKTHRVVWRGEAADVLSLPVGDPAEASQQISGAVAKMFAKYPPQPHA